MTNDFTLRPIILFFVVVILGVTFLSVIADNQIANTELSNQVNESITMTSQVGTNTNYTITSFSGGVATIRAGIKNVTFFGNGTGVTENSTHEAGILATEEINWTRSGVITIAGGTVFPGAGPYNISFTYDDNVTGTTTNADVTGVTFFGDSNVSTHHSTVVVNQQVNFTKATGKIDVTAANFTNRVYNISYPYEGSLYVSDTTSHPILKLLTIFFVLVIFAFGIVAVRDSSGNFSFGFGKQ